MVHYVYFKDGTGKVHVMCDRAGKPIGFPQEINGTEKIDRWLDLFDLPTFKPEKPPTFSSVMLNEGDAVSKVDGHFGPNWQRCKLKESSVFPTRLPKAV